MVSDHWALPSGAITFMLNLSAEDVSIVPAKPHVEFNGCLRTCQGGKWYNFHINIAWCPRSQGKYGNQEIDVSARGCIPN